jgi:RNA polymerase sigma-70 factor (ECF subfamily)
VNYHKSKDDIEKELAEIKAAQANPAYFGVLYDRYFKAIFVFVYRRVGEEELAADLTQQVFLKALAFISKYKFQGVPFSAWLFRIALNEVNMYFRKNKTGRTISLVENDISELFEDDKEDTGINTERTSLIIEAISQLDEESVQLLELRFFEKRSFAEIGNILGITENNAKVKVYRVLDKIKNMLGIKK